MQSFSLGYQKCNILVYYVYAYLGILVQLTSVDTSRHKEPQILKWTDGYLGIVNS